MLLDFIPYLPAYWNKQIITIEMFHEEAQRKNIQLRLSRTIKEKGYYKWLNERPVIGIDCRLRGAMRRWTALHELGHFFIHSPEKARYLSGKDSKVEAQANAFAACGLMPLPLFRKYPLAYWVVEQKYEEWMITKRKNFYLHYGI